MNVLDKSFWLLFSAYGLQRLTRGRELTVSPGADVKEHEFSSTGQCPGRREKESILETVGQ